MRIPFTNIEIGSRNRLESVANIETRSITMKPSNPWEDGWWYGTEPYENSSGQDVTEDSAMRYSAVWACVKVISEDLASLPLLIYRRDGKSKERAPENPVYGLLHDAPNEEMSAMAFREAMQIQVLLWGNAFAEIQRDLRGRPMGLWPLNPSKMEMVRDADNRLAYEYLLEDGRKKPFALDDILHLSGLSYNGITGLSPIGYHAATIGCGLAGGEMQGANYKSGAFPSISITHPAPKAPSLEGIKKFREDLAKEYSGSKNRGKILTLWEGMKAEALSMSMKDAEFIDSLKWSRIQIASIFRVPPHKIMDLDRATFSNIEQQSISYVVDAIRPWAVRWEQAINQRLLGGSETYYAEHLLDGLLRGDILSRYQAYAVGRQWGWMSINDIRQLENMNPVEDGDDYLQPMNMVAVGEEPPAPVEKPSDAVDEKMAASLRLMSRPRR